MVFPQTLNCASAAFEKAASLSKEKLIEFLILFQSYFFISLLWFDRALELVFNALSSVICSYQTSGFKCLLEAQSVFHFRLGRLGSRGYWGQLSGPRGFTQCLSTRSRKRFVWKPLVWFAWWRRSFGAKYALASCHNQTSQQFQLPLHTPKLLPSQLLSKTNESCAENYGGHKTCKKEYYGCSEWKAACEKTTLGHPSSSSFLLTFVRVERQSGRLEIALTLWQIVLWSFVVFIVFMQKGLQSLFCSPMPKNMSRVFDWIQRSNEWLTRLY